MSGNRDDDSVTYSLLEGEEEENASRSQPVRVMTRSGPLKANTFGGRLRGTQRVAFLITLSVFFVVIVWLLSNMEPRNSSSSPDSLSLKSYYLEEMSSHALKPDGSKKASSLEIYLSPNDEWYTTNCYGGKKLSISIGEIFEKLQLLKASTIEDCNLIWVIFNNMLRMEAIEAPIVLPAPFQEEVKGWLHNNLALFEQVNHQVVYKIVNKGTFEETVFNPVRANRPVSKPPVDPVEYIKNLTESTAPNCDFCKYKDHTAADTFGRIDNKLSASASNTFKLAKFHGLFFPKQHHPLNLSQEVLEDLFLHTSREWFDKAHAVDPEQRYPSLMWDTLPHAGASQVHPHVHGVLDAHQYVGGFESWHQMSIQYFKKLRRSFWTDFVKLHFALGLGDMEGEAVVLVPLTARKDHEFMILSPSLNKDVVFYLYSIIRTYQSRLNVYCFSGGGVYPQMGSTGDEDSGMPVIFRIGSRGTCTAVGSDVSSLELYTINNINSDIAKTRNELVKEVMQNEREEQRLHSDSDS